MRPTLSVSSSSKNAKSHMNLIFQILCRSTQNKIQRNAEILELEFVARLKHGSCQDQTRSGWKFIHRTFPSFLCHCFNDFEEQLVSCCQCSCSTDHKNQLNCSRQKQKNIKHLQRTLYLSFLSLGLFISSTHLGRTLLFFLCLCWCYCQWHC